MECICLVSSSHFEIQQFEKANESITRIVSNLDGFISPRYDAIRRVFKSVDTCIIGETPNFSDEFICRIGEIGDECGIKIINYHISMANKNNMLQKINVPVIFISSLLPDMGKSAIGLSISQSLKEKNFKPLFISSNPMWKRFDCETFPFFVLKKKNPILELNDFLEEQLSQSDYNIVVMCIPGGIIQSEKYNLCCDYGLLNYIIYNAVKPTYILNCIHQNTVNLNAIPQPFTAHLINKHLRTDRILDQNTYDFYIKNRNIAISGDMREDDDVYNLFDDLVFEKIANDIIENLNHIEVGKSYVRN